PVFPGSHTFNYSSLKRIFIVKGTGGNLYPVCTCRFTSRKRKPDTTVMKLATLMRKKLSFRYSRKEKNE
ncbi:MAG: hypothetical protein ABUL46_02755, partial [Chitinophaga rupis]